MNTYNPTHKYPFDVSYVDKVESVLAEEGSDKVIRHSYGGVYADILCNLVGLRHCKILEIGVLRGASLRAYRRLVPNVELYGIDIKGIPVDYATIIRGDGYSPETWKSLPADFDLIIDDGSHRERDMLRGLPSFVSHLKKGGVLLIEDIPTDDVAERVSAELPGSVFIHTPDTSKYNDDRIVIYTA